MLRRVCKEVEDQSKHGIITLPEGEREAGREACQGLHRR